MHGVEEKKSWDDAEDAAPDSSVRPTQPAPPPRSEEPPSASSRRTGSIAIGSIRAPAQSTMSVSVSIAVSPALMASAGAGGWYLTLSRNDGTALFEGPLDELGKLDTIVSVPCGTRSIKALIESSTKYKDAVVVVSDTCFAEHTFA